MIEKFFGYQRLPRHLIENEKFNSMTIAVQKPTINEFLNVISPIWKRVLDLTGHSIPLLFETKKRLDEKVFFEEYFVNGLSDGAALGSEMSSLRSLMKIHIRERKRRSYLNNILEISNLDINKFNNLYEFGMPWIWNKASLLPNPELVDHIYFWILVRNFIITRNDLNLIFLGDGCGYLSQLALADIPPDNLDSVTFIDLYHFLARQYLLVSDHEKINKFTFLNGEKYDYPTSSKDKILINQDSFPEINKQEQDKYFTYIEENNVKYFFSYNKNDHSDGHINFRNDCKKIFGEPIILTESLMRPGYYFELWKK